jgi:demethylmenaquinone methyltransferase / 2-methoxy-6-polyprenyl-1,4-benzoquinol methylase
MSSERAAHARRLFDSIAPRYDRPAEILGLGQYHRWRRGMAAGLDLRPGSLVLDVATGTGLVAREILGRFDVRVVGLDQSAEMIRVAANRGIEGLTLVRGDAQRLPFPDGSFDAVSFTYLLRYVDDPATTLGELVRVLRPGGQMASIEFGVPESLLVRKAWDAYALLLFPAAARAVSPGWRHVGSFLGRSIAAFDRDFPPERLETMWRAAGMGGVRTKRMSLGGGVVTWGRKGD